MQNRPQGESLELESLSALQRPWITFRAVALGAALIPVTCLYVIETEIVWYSGQPTTISLLPHVVTIVFILALCNLVVRHFRPRAALNPGELIVVYTMLSLASVMSGHDLIQILVPSLTQAYWVDHVSPEARWGEIFHQYLPKFLLVSDLDVIEGYYEGGSTMYSWAVLRAWGPPLLWWSSFLFALVGGMFLINVILRKQWTENEKLSYPIIQIPLQICTGCDRLLRSRLFWYGFVITFVLTTYNGLAVLFPRIPEIPIVNVANVREWVAERPWTAISWCPIRLYPFAIALCFFLPADLAFSCWFFFLFFQFERIVTMAWGATTPGMPFINEQTAGGYLGLCVLALWVSRHYLKRVGRKVLGLPSDLDDSQEPLRYRTATILLIAVLIYQTWFLTQLGLAWYYAIPFLLIYFAIAIAIARMRAELGPPAHDLHFAGPDQMLINFVGSKDLGPRNLTGLALTWCFNRAYRGHPIAHSLEGFKIAERLKLNYRTMFAAMCLAVVLGTFAGFWAMLHTSYRSGASAAMVGPNFHFGTETYDHLRLWISDPKPRKPKAMWATGIGVGVALLLAALRLRFVSWPLHPVGFAVSGSWSMEQLWCPMFIGWLLKVLILRYGGGKVYQRAITFFVGVVVGEFLVGCFWLLYGAVRGVQVYDFWPY